MTLIKNAAALYQCSLDGIQSDVNEFQNYTLAYRGDTIAWVGPDSELPSEYASDDVIDAHGKIVIPGLIDCHTHLAFGGWRGDEFELRILGRPYLEIQQAGGGIASSMKHTRAASEETLLNKALQHLQEIASLGVTTLEAKTGYGLNKEHEEKVLRVYKELQKQQALDILPTLLAAHIVPPEYKAKREDYISIICDEIIPSVAEQQLARFCDVFVEEGAYSIEEGRTVLECGKRYGLIPKLHVDQLSAGGGAELAAEVGAVSADHLEFISHQGILAMLEKKVTAVNLPLASLYTFQKALDARALIDTGLPVAIATDFNPGSAPSYHLPMVMMLSCTMNRMTPAEVLKGVTIYAARALGITDTHGSLEVGKQADIALIDSPNINHWMYHFRGNCCAMTIKKGQVIYQAP